MKKMVVDVSVAALWTSPESPREVDRPILGRPVRLEQWLERMSYDERLSLCTDNLVQSQVLYGTEVGVIEERDEWAKAVVFDQPSSKDSRGYPGWLVKKQLHYPSKERRSGTVAVVNRPTAHLYRSAQEKIMKVSFQTRLPVESEREDWIGVHTPAGTRLLRREDVFLERGGAGRSVSGADIVKAGEQFLGLPYLWGGMSGFGYDCSGFAHMMHRSAGLVIPRDASDQAKDGKGIEQNRLKPGDLLFFAYEKGKGRVHHVGIYYGGEQMLHAPKTGKSVEVIRLPGSEYEIEFCGARRYW